MAKAKNWTMTIAERMEQRREEWKELPVHPEAAKLPMMTDAELDELARDIETHGLQEPIILWCDNRGEPKGEAGPFPKYLLDGRNRMAALRRLGIINPHDAPFGAVHGPSRVRTLNAVKQVSFIGLGPRGGTKSKWVPDTDPTTFVLSLNVHRRHLTREQKREAIKAYIKADPKASNRKVARELRVSPSTVTAVRDDVQGVQVGQVEHPADRAAAVLKANPEMTQREVAAEAGVSLGTVSRVRRKLEEVEVGGPLPRGSDDLTGPIMDYLADAGGPRSATQVEAHLTGLGLLPPELLARHPERLPKRLQKAAEEGRLVCVGETPDARNLYTLPGGEGGQGSPTPTQPKTKAVEDFGVRVFSLASLCRENQKAGIPKGLPQAQARELFHELVGAHVALGKLMRELEGQI